MVGSGDVAVGEVSALLLKDFESDNFCEMAQEEEKSDCSSPD
jgi:hypothetical protein